jgi:pyruvate ferredoxin oxidoreductase alpha subunit
MTEQAKKKIGIEVSLAISEAVKQCDTDVVSAYPITPQTHIVEHLADLVANGELDAEFIPVESEHTAMSVCAGSSAAGARTFTATASQGLALMAEIVYCVSAMRLPIVMVMANRSLNSPLSIWNDHSDAMMVRDSGWVQIFVENGQEAYDHVFWCFRVGEDHKVMHPVMLNMDGFIVTHVVEPIEFWTDNMVKKFLPPFKPLHRLHPDNPITMGAFGPPEIFTEAKMAQEHALVSCMPTIEKAWEELYQVCGRRYLPVEKYRADDAKTLFLTMGSIGETARVAIDEMRETGEEIGLVSLRLWRPFPHEQFKAAVKNAETLIVIDRAISFGNVGGPVALEVKASLFSEKKRPKITNFIAGLAGRDVQPDDFWQMAEQSKKKVAEGKEDEFVIYGVRG